MPWTDEQYRRAVTLSRSLRGPERPLLDKAIAEYQQANPDAPAPQALMVEAGGGGELGAIDPDAPIPSPAAKTKAPKTEQAKIGGSLEVETEGDDPTWNKLSTEFSTSDPGPAVAVAPKRKAELPSAGGYEEDYADPEYMPEGLGMAKAWLPAGILGGKNIQFFEPPADFVRKLLTAEMGDRALMLDDEDVAIRRKRDQMWKEARTRAEQGGYAITRVDYASDPRWRQKVGDTGLGGRLKQAGRGLQSGAMDFFSGAQKTALLGGPLAVMPVTESEEVSYGSAARDVRKAREQDVIGQLAGGFMGAPMALAGAAVGAAKALPQVGRAGQALLAGGAVAGGEVVGQDIVEGAGDFVAGGEFTFDPMKTASRAEDAFMFGAPTGFAGEYVSRAAGRGVGAIENDPLVRTARGAVTDPKTGKVLSRDPGIQPTLFGWEEPAHVQTAREAARHQPSLTGTEEFREGAMESVMRGAGRHQKKTTGDIGLERGKYLALAGQEKVTGEPAIDAIDEMLEASVDEMGVALPANRQRAEKLNQKLKEFYRPVKQPVTDPELAEFRARNGRMVENPKTKETEYFVPREFTVREVDRMLDELVDMAKLDRPASAPKDPLEVAVTKGVYKMRDQFPAIDLQLTDGTNLKNITATLPDGTVVRGYSALKKIHEERLAEAKKVYERAGVPGEVRYKPKVTDDLVTSPEVTPEGFVFPGGQRRAPLEVAPEYTEYAQAKVLGGEAIEKFRARMEAEGRYIPPGTPRAERVRQYDAIVKRLSPEVDNFLALRAAKRRSANSVWEEFEPEFTQQEADKVYDAIDRFWQANDDRQKKEALRMLAGIGGGEKDLTTYAGMKAQEALQRKLDTRTGVTTGGGQMQPFMVSRLRSAAIHTDPILRRLASEGPVPPSIQKWAESVAKMLNAKAEAISPRLAPKGDPLMERYRNLGPAGVFSLGGGQAGRHTEGTITAAQVIEKWLEDYDERERRSRGE